MTQSPRTRPFQQVVNDLRRAIADLEHYQEGTTEHTEARNRYLVAFNNLRHTGLTAPQIFHAAGINLAQFKGSQS